MAITFRFNISPGELFWPVQGQNNRKKSKISQNENFKPELTCQLDASRPRILNFHYRPRWAKYGLLHLGASSYELIFKINRPKML